MTNNEKEILLDIVDLIKVAAARTEMSNDDFSYVSDIAAEIEERLNGRDEYSNVKAKKS